VASAPAGGPMASIRRTLVRPVALLAGVVLAAACEKGPRSSAPATLTVGAASSLKELCESTAAKFEAAHAGTRLRFSFDASSTLSRQVEAGGAFECLLS